MRLEPQSLNILTSKSILEADTSAVIAYMRRAVHLHGLADEEHSYVIKKHGEQKTYGTLSRELSQML